MFKQIAERGMMRIVKIRTSGSLLILGWISTVIGCHTSKNDYAPPPPPEVTVAYPVQKTITPFLEQNGVIEAVDEADVRARVRGFIESVNFDPGQQVNEGDVLYKIEADQYQAVVNSAKASVAASQAAIEVANALVKTANAEVKRAEQSLARERSLMKRNAGSQAELDAAIAANDAAIAARESAKANVEAAVADKGSSVASLAQAQLDLEYTTVKSPISGRISATDIKQGNLVDNGAKLATVVNRSQVFANFSISDREMLRVMKAKRAALKPDEKLAEPDWSKMKVFLKREGDEGFPFEGALNYVDQEGIDASTGTLGLRAQFDNRNDLLIPGLFVTLRMPMGDASQATLIPEYAVLRDQQGQYVLVVNSEQKVQRVEVSIAETISGWAVIASGLSLDSSVVIDGLQRARPGLAVKAMEKKLQVDDQSLLRGTSSGEDHLNGESTVGSETNPSAAE
jgi:RND family efflux transporter MFP subunit